MKRFSEQFNKKANSIRLKAEEKSELRDRLVSYMEYHPLPASKTQEVSSGIQMADSSLRTVRISKLRLFQWSGAMAIIFTLVIPYVAERAVPGDALYAVKVNFNEEVRSTLALSPHEKIAWETERLNRRIAEARVLADEGRLTEEAETMMADAVREHNENARKEIEHLKQTDKEEAALASIQFDTTLDIQSASLKSTHKNSDEAGPVSKIENVIAESQKISAVTELENLPSYDRLMGRVERETTRAHELLNGINELATSKEKDDIERRLEDIDRKVKLAMSTSETSEIESREQLVAALKQTQRLIVFMTNIDVRESVTVDDIVPVTLTDEERVEAIDEKIKETSKLNKDIRLALESGAVSSDLFEKVVLANSKSESLLTEVSVLVEGESYDLDKAESLMTEAHDLAVDALKMLDKDGIKVIDGENEEVGGAATGTAPIDGEVFGTSTVSEGSNESATTTKATTTDVLPKVEGVGTSTTISTTTEGNAGTSSEEIMTDESGGEV